MVSISSLKKNKEFMSRLGYREKEILESKGAKIKVARDYPPKGAYLEVINGDGSNSFVFAQRDTPNSAKYDIIA